MSVTRALTGTLLCRTSESFSNRRRQNAHAVLHNQDFAVAPHAHFGQHQRERVHPQVPAEARTSHARTA